MAAKDKPKPDAEGTRVPSGQAKRSPPKRKAKPPAKVNPIAMRLTNGRRGGR